MVISFVNAKGGVGKTTVATHFAIWLKEQGRKVDFIDADKQELSAAWVTAVDSTIPVYKVATQDGFLEQMKALLPESDIIIIDGPGGDSDLTRMILLKTDMAILPCAPSLLDLKSTNREIRVVQQAQELREGKLKAFFLPNRVEPEQAMTRELLKMSGKLGIPFTENVIRARNPYADSFGQSTVVWRMGHGGRFAAEEITKLFKELMQHETQNAGKLVGNS